MTFSLLILPLFVNDKVDEELRLRNVNYNRLRQEGQISEPVVHVVRPSAFHELREHILTTTTTTAIQFKVPRKLRSISDVDFLMQYVDPCLKALLF